MYKKEYEYIIIGAGIAGCSVAHFLSRYSDSILLIDKNSDVGFGASGAAGAFLSPLLGKPNKFKDLVTKALKFSTAFYKENFPNELTNCGVVRIPKNNEDRVKFESYIPYMDFPYKQQGEGYFFEIGSQVNSQELCELLSKNVNRLFNYEVKSIKKVDNSWLINEKIKGNKLILTTGANIDLIKEEYFKIRAVWGQKIDIYTTTCINKNYHKACSVSHSRVDEEKGKNIVSIGATHHRLDSSSEDYKLCVYGTDINKNTTSLETSQNDTKELLEKANDILKLENVEVFDLKIGARSSSVDYFPMVGELVDSSATVEKYPHLKNGSFIKDKMLLVYEDLYVLNGVGGRGFVLSPYLANQLVEHLIKNNKVDNDVLTHRLFKRWVKKKVNF